MLRSDVVQQIELRWKRGTEIRRRTGMEYTGDNIISRLGAMTFPLLGTSSHQRQAGFRPHEVQTPRDIQLGDRNVSRVQRLYRWFFIF